MGFLTGVEIRRRIEAGQIEIHSLDGDQPFSVDSQVTEDSIDLRLAPVALSLRDDVSSLDYLGEGLDKYFDTLEIGANGFELEPLKPILAQTLEAVCFPDNLVGLVSPGAPSRASGSPPPALLRSSRPAYIGHFHFKS